MTRTRPFPGGIHVPCLTFFKDDPRQEIDWELQDRHFDFLVDSGLHGIIIAGSNGEAVTLSTREKTDLVQHARQRARLHARPDIPLTLGCSGQATRQVVDETIAAGEAGADFALVLVPSYYHFAMDAGAIVAFFQEVADHSPVPVMVYNFPGVSAGIDVDADMLCALSRHPNIAGVKLTCGGIGKVPRVTAGSGAPFGVLSGQVDWMVPALSVGAIGAITGMANLFPRSCVELYNIYQAGKTQEAADLQLTVATSEAAFGQGGINGSKWVVAKLLGYPMASAACRRPYPLFTDKSKQDRMLELVEKLRPVEEKLVGHSLS
ncbi:dihydrodipicolinate synthetase family protein [Aspergillus sp. HF37]|nr:dihydrodipicolinate synthetase family protein [Aspergillus sp. HF37]